MRPVMEPAADTSVRKPWAQKIRREVARLLGQADTLVMRPAALATRSQFLFVLAHMRSGSSLLRYLLSGSQEIIGIGETHNNYRRRSDLAKLLTCIRRATGKNPLRYRYVVDKIVATHHILSDRVLADRRTRYVFLVREPHATIDSIVAMRRQISDQPAYQLVSDATEHYLQRLAQLRQYAATIDDETRCLLLTHHHLVGTTAAAFLALEQFLDLRSPLQESYQPGVQARRPDRWVSPKIGLGVIDRSPPRHERVALPTSLQDRLQEAYDVTLTELQQRMQTVEPHLSVERIARAA